MSDALKPLIGAAAGIAVGLASGDDAVDRKLMEVRGI